MARATAASSWPAAGARVAVADLPGHGGGSLASSRAVYATSRLGAVCLQPAAGLRVLDLSVVALGRQYRHGGSI